MSKPTTTINILAIREEELELTTQQKGKKNQDDQLYIQIDPSQTPVLGPPNSGPTNHHHHTRLTNAIIHRTIQKKKSTETDSKKLMELATSFALALAWLASLASCTKACAPSP